MLRTWFATSSHVEVGVNSVPMVHVGTGLPLFILVDATFELGSAR